MIGSNLSTILMVLFKIHNMIVCLMQSMLSNLTTSLNIIEIRVWVWCKIPCFFMMKKQQLENLSFICLHVAMCTVVNFKDNRKADELAERLKSDHRAGCIWLSDLECPGKDASVRTCYTVILEGLYSISDNVLETLVVCHQFPSSDYPTTNAMHTLRIWRLDRFLSMSKQKTSETKSII